MFAYYIDMHLSYSTVHFIHLYINYALLYNYFTI